jgi:hypothetical protein
MSEKSRPTAELSDVFHQSDVGLAILGAPGSGKTIALLQLTNDLIEAATTDINEPVPVVLLLSSWANRRKPLEEWIVDELNRSYDVPRRTASEWIERKRVLLLLDGLDEVTEPYSADCVDAIRRFQLAHGPARLVICSRTDDYDQLPSRLKIDEVELQPLSARQVAGHLRRAPLADVRSAIMDDNSLARMLQSPLVLSTLIRTYETGHVASLVPASSHKELLSTLFGSFTQRMLDHREGLYSPARTREWLAWLAGTMRDLGQTEFHLDRIRPDMLPAMAHRRLMRITVAASTGLLAGVASVIPYSIVYGVTNGSRNSAIIALFFALFAGLGWEGSAYTRRFWGRLKAGLLGSVALGLVAGSAISVVDGVVAGLFFSSAFLLFSGLRQADPVEQLRWHWRRAGVGMASGMALGTILGVVYGLGYGVVSGLMSGLAFGLVFGGAVGLFGTLAVGLVPGLVGERVAPNEGIHRSARLALASGLTSGLIAGLALGLTFELVLDIKHGLAGGIHHGLMLGLGIGLLTGGLSAVHHLVMRLLLVYARVAPLNYIRFLNEATARLLLRRAGSGYIFAHGLLLDYFAHLRSERLVGERE